MDLKPRSFPFPLETGQLMAFRRAIGEAADDPAVPPTFVMAADLFDPMFERRPDFGETGSDEAIDAVFHAEQLIDYYRPLAPGMRLVASKRSGRTWSKQGRKGGRLDFTETLTELHDESGRLLLRSSWIDVRTEQSHSSLTAGQTGADVSGEDRAANAPGNCACVISADAVTRTRIVMYIGAAGDFHPLHHDESYALAHGYPSIFAPGMLTMALNTRAVTGVLRINSLQQVRARFKAQVWPGDRLSTSISVSREDPSLMTATTFNQNLVTVLESRCRTIRPVHEVLRAGFADRLRFD